MLENVKTWLPWDEIEEPAQQQIKNASLLPIIDGKIAIMPDCHFGKGATVGSVIPTYKAIIPAAVGVDIGCGMEAIKLPCKASDLDERALRGIFNSFCRDIPLGAGGKHYKTTDIIDNAYKTLIDSTSPKLRENLDYFQKNPALQLGTLGSGNHFIELCSDQNDDLWLMLHSGSRGIGNRIGTHYIEKAKGKCAELGLPDSDLSFFSQGDEYFSEYCDALNWAQKYAAFNRTVMVDACLQALKKHKVIPQIFGLVATHDFQTAISCHHNYVEVLDDFRFITRKGAISAKKGQLGIIPGSMGTKSYIVRGLGNPESHESASHGAGRAMSRGAARRAFSVEDLKAQTEGVICIKNQTVLDEIPAAYKDIDTVIERQKDLIEVVFTLKQIMNVKGG